MATLYSTEMTNVIAVPSVKLPVSDMAGKLRMARFSYVDTVGAAGDTLQLVKLPAGRVRFIGALSYCRHNLTVGSATIDIGWGAYTDLDGTAVAADGDGLDDGLDVDATGLITAMGTVTAVAAVGNMKVFESQTGVIITMTLVGEPAADDYLYGDIVYATD